MRPDDRNNRIGKLHLLQDLGPNQGVDFHLFELFVGELSGFRDDVLGDGQFTDIVQHGGCAQGIQFLFV